MNDDLYFCPLVEMNIYKRKAEFKEICKKCKYHID